MHLIKISQVISNLVYDLCILIHVGLLMSYCVGLDKWLACPTRTVGRGFMSWPGHTKDHHRNGTNCLPARNALGLEFGGAARLSKRPCSVWNCLWGNALKRSPEINRKSRVLYPSLDIYLVLHSLHCRKSTVMD